MRSKEVESTSVVSEEAQKTEEPGNKENSTESPEKETARTPEVFSYDLHNLGDFFSRNFFVVRPQFFSPTPNASSECSAFSSDTVVLNRCED